MRLITFSEGGYRRAGALLDDERVVDFRVAAERAGLPALPAEMETLLAAGDDGMEQARRLMEWARENGEGLLSLSDAHVETPVTRPGKILAMGLNYRAHAEEVGAKLPEHPIVFTKLDTTLVGPGHPVHIPRASHRVDWEGELCFVIGRPARHVPRDRALEYIAGYTIGNDVSVRDWQAHAATWTMGKGFDTHGPVGPWLVTRDEVPDPRELRLRTWVNDELKQDTSVSDLIFDIPAQIEYLSTACTLRPGDVVFTGTPSGVGQAQQPRQWLKAGDEVRVAVDGPGVSLGELRNTCIDEPME